MRAFGGLILFLLLGVGLYLYLSASNAQTVIKQSKPAKAAVEEVAGVGMKESFELEAVEVNGKTTGLKLTRLDPAGPLAHMYDLKIGDVITEVGPFSVRDTDTELVRALILESGNKQSKLVVQRAGQKVELENHGDAAGYNKPK